ncbi:MAG TPA: hypothetical protein VJO13_15955 [Ktedonobacterales bacterium]|jgi:hypothetical protein|nr:hypothetical protein [Ktedonobacterales bacterium]
MMDDNPLFDGGQRAANDPGRLLYSGTKQELQELRQSVAEENLALTAGAKARRRRIIGIAIFCAFLALFAAYAIIQILGR